MAAIETSRNERPGSITFKGNPMTLIGPELKVGDPVPEFHVQTAAKLETVGWNELSENGTKAVLMILVPSIDTNICSLETNKFNRHVASLPSNKLKTVAVSADTPFAQTRWAKEERITNLQMLSDHKDRVLGEAFGTQVKELGLLSRSIYLIDKDGIVRYLQTVPEIASEPDYDEVLMETRKLLEA